MKGIVVVVSLMMAFNVYAETKTFTDRDLRRYEDYKIDTKKTPAEKLGEHIDKFCSIEANKDKSLPELRIVYSACQESGRVVAASSLPGLEKAQLQSRISLYLTGLKELMRLKGGQ